MRSTREWFERLDDPSRRHKTKLFLGGIRDASEVELPVVLEMLHSEVSDRVFWALIVIAQLARLGVPLENCAGLIASLAQTHGQVGVRQGALHALGAMAPTRRSCMRH